MATSATGSCAACGYNPVAYEADCCPRCGARNRNPTAVDWFVGRGMLIGLAGGAFVGGLIGWFSGQLPGNAVSRPVMAFVGALVGAVPGFILGLFLGLVTALVVESVSRLSGRRFGVQTKGFIVPDASDVYYCGHCRRQQTVTDGEDCVHCGRLTVSWSPARESEASAQRKWEGSDRNR